VQFDLHLESGPQRRRTWIYVPGLPGCSTVAPTTRQAYEAASAAIRLRLDFLRRHGETELADGRSIDAAEPLELTIAGHVIERKLLGFGQQFFPPDLEPLPAADVPRLLRWAAWSREELVEAARSQSLPVLEKPATGGRSAAGILSHVASSEWAYVSASLGTLKGASAAMAAIEAAGDAPWEALAAERRAVVARLSQLTESDRERLVERNGSPRWTARRMFRRLLEHEWEHVLELRDRLG
jgi:uncharacterized damage-inducible protein DinB/predicted RNase H-like HicB family nuclease